MTKGFTLIELLLVVVIIGIVAAFVLPKFGDVKEKAYISAMKNDLRNLATDQEIYFDNWEQYRDRLNENVAGTSPVPPTTEDVNLYYDGPVDENSTGYKVAAVHFNTDLHCVMNRTNTEQDIGYPTIDESGNPTGFGGTIANVQVGEIKCQTN